MEQRVDLVYLWVDGNDPVWQEQKERALAECGVVLNRQAIAKGRFEENEELRYSLRSVARNAPWIGNIFIITANQTPAWLNTNHPKIRLISHNEILPEEYLPTFNSTAIEMSIARIPALGERFILANDDMFILKPIEESFFYNAEGLPIARYSRHISTKQSLYLNKVRRAQELVAERCGKLYTHQPHHNMDAYLKSDVVACCEAFTEEVEASRSHRFRLEREFHRSAWLYWAMARGRAEEKILSHYSAAKSWREMMWCRLRGRYCTDSREMGLHRGSLLRRIRKYNPSLLCLNDTERTTDAQRQSGKALLERLFPEKCEFEL